MRTYFVSRGFTLIELVVVLFIIGVVFTSAIVVLPLGRGDPLQRELETLTQRVDRIRDKAVFGGRPYGLGLWRGGYGFFAWDPGQGWLVINDLELPSAAELKTVEVLQMVSAGLTIAVAQQPVSGPHVVFQPSGEVSTLDARLLAVSGDEYGFSINALGDAGFSLR